MFLALFGSFSSLAITPSIVALKDPPVYRGKLPSFQLYRSFWPPTENSVKPRVAFYVCSTFVSTITLLPKFFSSNDIMALEPFTPDRFFDPSMVGFTIDISYSTKGRSKNTRLVLADLILPDLSGPVLTLGDLNIHHPTPSECSKKMSWRPRSPTSTEPRILVTLSSTPLGFIPTSPCLSWADRASLTWLSLVRYLRLTSQNGPTPCLLEAPTTSQPYFALMIPFLRLLPHS